MAVKQKRVLFTGILGIVICLSVIFSGNVVSAVDCDLTPTAPGCEDQTGTGDTTDAQTNTTTEDCDASKGETCCGKVKTSIISDNDICKDNGGDSPTEQSMIWNLLIAVLNIMTAGIGIAAVGGIVYGALLYTTAEDKPDQTKKAIGVITNVVIGLVAYGLMYVLLNFLIPGGIFN